LGAVICRDTALDIRGIVCKFSPKNEAEIYIDTLCNCAAHTKKTILMFARLVLLNFLGGFF
jgi:hypothetical protein